MRVKLSSDDIYPVYYDWYGFGSPEYDVEIPDELWNSYKEALSTFTDKLQQLNTFLGND